MAELTIKNWDLGVGESPYVGFSQMVNVDIYSKPGCVKISNNLIVDEESVGVVDELIIWAVQDPQNNDIYGVDREGKLYKRDRGTSAWTLITGHSTSGDNGQGLGLWKDYLFYARNSAIDVYGPLSGAPAWENNWESLNSASFHPMMSAQDDFLYIGNRNFIDTVNEVLGQTFDPTDPTTYTYNSEDLELRSDYVINCLEEQGSNIIIGTYIGINNAFNVADVFIWDGTSDSFQLNGTIHLVENGVKMMKNVNNVLHILAGNGVPRLFGAVTSQSTELKKLNSVEVPFNTGTNLNQGSIDLLNGEVMFGIGSNVDSVSPTGVYALRSNAYVLRYTPSTGNNVDTLIGIVKVIDGNRILVAWKDDNETPEFGVDILTENYYTNWMAYVESPLYTVGTEDDPTTFEKVRITMGKKLAIGDGIRLKARYSLDESFTTIATIDTTVTAAYVGMNTFDIKVGNLGKFKEFQCRVELNTDDESTESPELKEIIFT